MPGNTWHYNTMIDVILYSTHCPKCNVIKKKMESKNISFNEINDIDTIKTKGFASMPMLEVDGKVLNFVEANSWISSS
jgi:glutaredoxin